MDAHAVGMGANGHYVCCAVGDFSYCHLDDHHLGKETT